MRPLLRWAGSKRQLLGRLRPYWDHARPARYVEPFAGSAALFFDIEPKAAVLGDSNTTLVQFYNALRWHSELVYELALSWKSDAAKYYEIRHQFKTERDKIRRSAMFFYLNRNCFNGIYRTNTKGEFNVPYSGSKTGGPPSWAEVEDAVQLIKRAEIRAVDYKKLLTSEVGQGDFVYLDPPYAVENRRVFVQYNAQTFGITDLIQLADTLHCIDALGAKFVLSYAVSSEALHLFKPWQITRVACQRNIAGFSDHRRRAMELMVSNIQLD